MSSCFRWKKKNSYTVTHEEEYSISGGKYNPHREPFVVKKNSELPAASTTAAKIWASESKDRAETNQNVPKTDAEDAVPVIGDLKEGKPNEKEAVRENGFRGHERQDSHSDSSSQSSVRKEDGMKSELEGVQYYEREAVEISYERQEKIDDVGGGKEEDDAEVAYDARPDSPATDHVNRESVAESPAYEVQVEAVSTIENQSAAVRTEDDSEEDYREDPVQAREEYLKQRQLEEEAAAMAAGSEEFMENRQQSDSEVLNESPELHTTDSPAGTWDARLNKDVCAEMEEQQRSSLANSKSNSEASLDPGDRRDVYPDDSMDPSYQGDVKQEEDMGQNASHDTSQQEDVDLDPDQDMTYQKDIDSETNVVDPDPKDTAVQQVQFNLSREQFHDYETSKTVNDVTYVIGQEGSSLYEQNQTYTLVDGSSIQEEMDNDINVHLDTTDVGQDGREDVHEEGVIELPEEVAISYEEPYSSSGQVDIAIHGSSLDHGGR